METIVLIIVVWFVLSIPISLLVARAIKGSSRSNQLPQPERVPVYDEAVEDVRLASS